MTDNPTPNREVMALLPCPFCGSECIGYEEDDHPYGVRAFCRRVLCEGKVGSYCLTKEGAAQVWNRRAIPSGGEADADLTTAYMVGSASRLDEIRKLTGQRDAALADAREAVQLLNEARVFIDNDCDTYNRIRAFLAKGAEGRG